MERLPQSRARLIVNVMSHGTVVGTEDAVRLEFEDCVNAVQGLASYLGELLSEVNAEDGYEITSAILIDALHHWTFDEHIDDSGQDDEDDEDFDDASDDDAPADEFPPN